MEFINWGKPQASQNSENPHFNAATFSVYPCCKLQYSAKWQGESLPPFVFTPFCEISFRNTIIFIPFSKPQDPSIGPPKRGIAVPWSDAQIFGFRHGCRLQAIPLEPITLKGMASPADGALPGPAGSGKKRRIALAFARSAARSLEVDVSGGRNIRFGK
ncbi:hypothetical protein [Azospirillum sp. TSH100]|uniref:hypothetical protein n=1 Tax=Azospirillum sp. TSH100 TaxID=652764 RepID=UPI0010AAE690|nr:hypothetical protein [Azospirillum sp. TSH100]QCG87667.1 hypothetical protein E6C72_07980 [Azospirillum sp. TSH100]